MIYLLGYFAIGLLLFGGTHHKEIASRTVSMGDLGTMVFLWPVIYLVYFGARIGRLFS